MILKGVALEKGFGAISTFTHRICPCPRKGRPYGHLKLFDSKPIHFMVTSCRQNLNKPAVLTRWFTR